MATLKELADAAVAQCESRNTNGINVSFFLCLPNLFKGFDYSEHSLTKKRKLTFMALEKGNYYFIIVSIHSRIKVP